MQKEPKQDNLSPGVRGPFKAHKSVRLYIFP